MKKGVLYTVGATIILVICFVAFVLPSSLGRSQARQEGVEFGKYNGKKIAYEYGSDFNDFLSQYADMFRSQGMEVETSQYYIFNYAFNSTVIKRAQEEALEKSGYKVSDELIKKQLIDYFKDENGNFSSKLYKSTDSATVENLRSEIENSLYLNRYYDDNFGSSTKYGDSTLYGLKISSNELAFLNSYNSEKRAFKMATFSGSNYPEEEKDKYAKANSAKFTKYDMSIITVQEKSLADKIASRLNKGDITFEDAVSEYSDKNYSDSEGKLTNSYQYQIESLLTNAEDLAKVVDLTVDGITPAVQTSMGYSIFKCNGAAAKADLNSQEIKDQVSNYILSYESTLVEDYFSTKAKELAVAAKTTDFETACENAGATITEIPAFALNYSSIPVADGVDVSISGLEAADKNENFLKCAFATKLNECSEPFVLNGDVSIVKYVEKVQNTDEPKTFVDELNNFNQGAAQESILTSPKLENNFMTAYFSQMM